MLKVIRRRLRALFRPGQLERDLDDEVRFHLDNENLDPKTWCRFPILSAGFAVELSELRKVRAP